MEGFPWLKREGENISPSPAYGRPGIYMGAWLVILREALVAPTEASVYPSRRVEDHRENLGSRS